MRAGKSAFSKGTFGFCFGKAEYGPGPIEAFDELSYGFCQIDSNCQTRIAAPAVPPLANTAKPSLL
jgi:hypothetical protein